MWKNKKFFFYIYVEETNIKCKFNFPNENFWQIYERGKGKDVCGGATV